MPVLLPELTAIRRLVDTSAPYLTLHTLGEIDAGHGERFPLLAVSMGSSDPAAPALGVFGGVHGLERIGAEVAMAFLRSLVERLTWDDTLHHLLAGMRLVLMPLVNPGGYWRGSRANPRGVDLMRNAPVDAQPPVPWLVSGQRISPVLPWYRGRAGQPMEAESQALCALVESQLLGRGFSIAVDCHSGFGLHDRIWFPYAHTAHPVEHLPELHALCEVFDRAQLHHRYVFEPQSRQYRTHGDLWDHLYDQGQHQHPGSIFLPLTLEMGSWLWVKKNPRQLFSRHGAFNPLIEHRRQRVLRRHVAWLDFIARATLGHAHWLPAPTERHTQLELALNRWYRTPRA
ncbi:MAG TPA: M14 family zinc carboxypeptidase [Ideonella sp.]|uniref:M14 family zinc carboxypeptidase n=1 Tax=Ideonella sp. TaxID=1929293 RepID=UPI002CDBC872|nr:M14 family zinc carboxypeptidase [Ideonella sp.]HSI51059.1 M14 family zinc carboxypeptidase [Ideonella sp.]